MCLPKYIRLLALAVSILLATSTRADIQRTIGITAAGVEVKSKDADKRPFWIKDAIHLEGPSYPFHDRLVRNEGQGRYRLLFNLKSGTVTSVVVVRKSGYDSLDQAAVSSFKQWHFRPGTWRSLEIPVSWLIHERGDYYRMQRFLASQKQSDSKNK